MKNPAKSSFITSLVTNNIKGTFSFVSKTETINLDFSCVSYLMAIILNIVVFTIIGGIAKSLIYSGTRLFEIPSKDLVQILRDQLRP